MAPTSEPIASASVAMTILTSLANAREKGGPWKALAEAYLGSTAATLERVEAMRITILRRQADPAATLAEMELNVLALLEDLADAIWKTLGQPAHDPGLSILSPGGTNFFFEWQIGDPADRLEVFAEMLSEGMPPGLDWARAKDVVNRILAILPQYRALREGARACRAKLEVLDKLAETVAREGHVLHSKLRRRMRADGYDPDEVRAIFPDVFGTSQTIDVRRLTGIE